MNDKTRLMSELAVISFQAASSLFVFSSSSPCSRSLTWWTFETQQRRTTLINKMQECCNIGPIHLVLLDDVKLILMYWYLIEVKSLGCCLISNTELNVWKTDELAHCSYIYCSAAVAVTSEHMYTSILMISQLWKY